MARALFPLPLVAALATAGTIGAQRTEPIVGLPCEGCELVFVGRPGSPPARATIAGPGEPGERLEITGTVRDARGRAVPGTIVYAYHTDAHGVYPPAAPSRPAMLHGRLRAFARTDSTGRYAFATIRPAGYPRSDLPQHVHLHVIEPGRCTYYVDDLMFADDPRLTAAKRRELATGRGGDAVATPVRDARGTWQATRDIVLGARIPGYDRCGARP